MKLFITTFLLATSLSMFGQLNTGYLAGKWKYKDVYEKEKVDAKGLKMLLMFFGEMTIQFDKNGLYKALIMGKEEQGKWTNETNKTISLASDKGKVTSMEVIELTEGLLTFKLGKSAFIMSKIGSAQNDTIVETQKTFETVKANTKQIAKKWDLVSKESSKDVSDKVKETFNELLQGSYMRFSKKRKYETKILNIKEKGKWKFGEGNESIVTEKDGNKQTWNIISISDNKMVLIQGLSKEKWTFTSK